MRKLRRNKSETRFYIIMSVVCLTILFAGYSYVYKLSEARKTGKEITTISINYDNKEAVEKYNAIFTKIMSYFNVFFEETFKETDDSSEIKNTEEYAENNTYQMTVSNQDELVELETFDDYEYENNIEDSKIYTITNRQEEFFTVAESLPAASRGGVPRQMSVDYKSINDKFNIVLYHTHGTESYLDTKETNYRTKNEDYNVMGLGTRITRNLKNYGLEVTHLKNYNDYPSYNASYANSNKKVKAELSDTKTNLIIDIHRDGAEENSSYEEFLSKVSKIEINGKPAATFMLVVGDANGNLKELKQMAQTVYDIANEMYPGLCREVVVRQGAYFNQFNSDTAMLIEIGSTVNNMEEVQYTSDLISEILCQTIIKINN